MTLEPVISLPWIALALGALALLLQAAFHRHHGAAASLAGASLICALISLLLLAPLDPRPRGQPLFVLDPHAVFYMSLILAASLFVALFSYGYLERREGHREEFYMLLLLATMGAAILAASNHFVSFFVALELLSVSLYALIAYPGGVKRPLEAGFKYLILATVSSSFLLFGMALLYAETGSMEFAEIAAATGARPDAPWLLLGSAMLITGIGFKLGVVPFHMWTPDVYEGAPPPVTAFVATVSKGSVFALLLRYFHQAGTETALVPVLTLIAVASMFAGNLLALFQDNVKRILAYSSIAHLGYLLVVLLSGGGLAMEAAGYYLTAYFVTTLGAFGIISMLSGHERDLESLDEYRGLFWEHPWIGGAFAAMVFSLAAIPLTAGFIGKFYIISAGVESSSWLPVFTLIASSAIGLFYYLRIVAVLFAPSPEVPQRLRSSLPAELSLAFLTLLLLWLGLYPSVFIRLVQPGAAALL